ncbi:MAG: hypothetical protein GXY07_09610 [Candidatus Hydrogenedentes bacterium]|nr:hypothetical protein [Candidatus Hydrogenedentota bacterium]
MIEQHTFHPTDGQPVSAWLAALASPEGRAVLRGTYGDDQSLLEQRAALACRALKSFQYRFGNLPVRVFRAPGRINLRGMHVDTHGGYLNLMTHQREVLLVVAPSENDINVLANVNPVFKETSFAVGQECGPATAGEGWFEFISQPSLRDRVNRRRATAGHGWANYCVGAALCVGFAFPGRRIPALKVMVDSDLPGGAALSSSASLSIAALQAYAGYGGAAMSLEQLVGAEQDVEWYAGARVGMSDQAAILMGRPGQLLHLALFAEDFRLDGARYQPFPDDLSLLVINSHTARNLSGAERVQYSLNRFAYSMALTVLRAELLRAGWGAGEVRRFDRLSRLTPEALGGPSRIYRLLLGVPEWINLDDLRRRYAPPNLDEAYVRYFDGLPQEEQPTEIPLRGPLLFGIAESERARRFPKLLERGDYEQAGVLMNTGHDGDRVVGRDGKPYGMEIGDAALDALAREQLPLALCPGRYGASSPALDALADAACTAGALGASLTGAGIAGAVLALCRAGDAEQVSLGVLRCLKSPAYARLVGWRVPPSAAELEASVVANHAVAGAGELVLA